jgi:foldase protein PrsA
MTNDTPEQTPAPQSVPDLNSTTPSPLKKFNFNLPKTVSMKKILIALIVIGLVALGFIYKGLFIAATVDGKPISRFAIVKALEKQSGRQVLDSMITEKLIDNEANKQNISVTDQEVDDQIKKIEEQIMSQGGKLDDVLAGQGMSRDDLRKQILLQQKAERIIAEKIKVTDEEIDKYIADNKVTITPGMEESQKSQIRDELKQQKFTQEIGTWLNDRKANATIKDFTNYPS